MDTSQNQKKTYAIPTWSQFRMFRKSFSSFEKRLIVALLFVAVFSFGIFSYYYIKLYAVEVPAYAGTYKEGVIGQPHFINPILADVNDVNRDITELVFSGLLKYNNRGGLELDLAKDYRISDDGRIYTVYLKDGVRWHDGEPFDADDVVFTVKTVQDPTIKSPMAINWQGVNVEKINNSTVQFILKKPYVPFIETLTMGIIPRHIWQKIPLNNFGLSEHNLKPIGTGSYQFSDFQKEKSGRIVSYGLRQYEYHHIKPPYIQNIVFYFFDNEEQLINALNTDKVMGISSVSVANLNALQNASTRIYEPRLFRYFAVFFNAEHNEVLKDKNVRRALNYATDKQAIVDGVFLGKAEIARSPVPENLIAPPEDIMTTEFSREKARDILEAAGWKIAEGEQFMTKRELAVPEKNQKDEKETSVASLSVEIVIPDMAQMKEVGTMIKDNWEAIGVQTTVTLVPASTQENFQIFQQDIIRPRNYQALLFGHVFLSQPDLFSFWYSSQKKYPGLNFSLFENKEVDKLLEDARQTIDEAERTKKINSAQNIIMEETPAIFLYNPYYLYPVHHQIKGISAGNIVLPSQRFSDIINWYIDTTLAL